MDRDRVDVKTQERLEPQYRKTLLHQRLTTQSRPTLVLPLPPRRLLRPVFVLGDARQRSLLLCARTLCAFVTRTSIVVVAAAVGRRRTATRLLGAEGHVCTGAGRRGGEVARQFSVQMSRDGKVSVHVD